MSYRGLGFPEYGMANASNFTRGFTPASNPERGNNTIYGQRINGLLFMLKGPRLKTVSSSSSSSDTVQGARRAAFYCRIIAHWRSGQEELVRLWFEGDDVKGMILNYYCIM